MSADVWFIIAIVGFSLSGIALIAAVLMFIKLNIPAVIGDLSGKTVAREIKAMRDANAASGTKIHQSSSVNVNRGKLTTKIKEKPTPSAQIAAHASHDLSRTDPTPAVPTPPPTAPGTEVLPAAQATEVLPTTPTAAPAYGRQTDVLSETQPGAAPSYGQETSVLSPAAQPPAPAYGQATAVLSDAPAAPAVPAYGQATAVLSDAPAAPAAPAYGQATAVLSDAPAVSPTAGTSVLSEAAPAPATAPPVAFKVTRSIVQVHAEGVS